MVQKIIAMISDLVLKSARNLIVDIIKIIATGLLDHLDHPLHIPIISAIYKQISGDDLTILNRICLIGAIPTNIIFKLIGNVAPYPDTLHTAALISASDFATLSKVLSSPEPIPFSQKLALSKVRTTVGPAPTKSATPSAPTAIAITTAALNISALLASVAVASFALVKRRSPFSIPLTRYLSAASYLLYVAPNFPSSWPPPTTWTATLNYAVTLISIGRALADSTAILSRNEKWNDCIAPALESVIIVVWFVPLCFGIAAIDGPTESDWLMLASRFGH